MMNYTILFIVLFHLLFLLRKKVSYKTVCPVLKKGINIFFTLENKVTAEPGYPVLGKVSGGGEGALQK